MSRLGTQCSLLLTKIKYERKAEDETRLMKLAWNHLLNTAKQYLYDKNDAEDVVQNSFLRALQYINSFQDDQDGFNWLCKIVQREAYDFNKNTPPTLSLDTSYIHSQQEDFTEHVINRTVIAQYLQPYEKRDRQIIYLHFFENFSFREIAAKLEMKKSNVHKRANAIMKEILKKSNAEM